MTPKDILSFWFEELSLEERFKKSEAIDTQITNEFFDIHRAAKECELFSWRSSIHGRLAEIIILDQFSRNMFRNSSRAFENDPMALALSQEAVQGGFDQTLNPEEKIFLYMPFMHSESRLIHEHATELYSQKGLEMSYEFELKHKAIIERFDRYPHRNEILGRPSTKEELEFLKQPGSSF